MVLLKCLSNFWRTFEVPLIICEINLILTWSANCLIPNAAVNQARITDSSKNQAITDAKLYVLVVILSTQDNPKLLQDIKSGFQRTIN